MHSEAGALAPFDFRYPVHGIMANWNVHRIYGS